MLLLKLGSYSVKSLSDSSPEDISPSGARARDCEVGMNLPGVTCGVTGLDHLLLGVKQLLMEYGRTYATLASREASVMTSSCSERNESSYSLCSSDDP
jgi:hypothetical protein